MTEALDFGLLLQDQISQVASANSAHIHFLGDVASFYRDLAGLERDYATKLQALIKKAQERRAKLVQGMVAGDNPASLPSENAYRNHTVDSAWSRMLSEFDEEAQDRLNFATSAQNDVCDALKNTEAKFEEIHKKTHNVSTKLTNERDRIYNDCSKAKEKYNEACQQLESYRSRRDNAKDAKHADKANKHYDEAVIEMLDAKNTYIVSIASSNATKAKFYQSDQVELQRLQQTEWTLIVQELSKVLLKAIAIGSHKIESLQRHNQNMNEALGKVNVEQDQQVFVDSNKRRFFQGPEFVFEPSPVWHDDDKLNTETNSKVFLQNKLINARQKLVDLDPLVESKKKEVDRLESLEHAYTQDSTLGNPKDILDQLLDYKRDLMTLETEKTVLETEIGVILPTIGDDPGMDTPHQFKPANFTIPTRCFVCDSKIWGHAKGFICQNCNISVHAKCHLRAPPNCTSPDGNFPVAQKQHPARRTPSIISSLSRHSSKRSHQRNSSSSLGQSPPTSPTVSLSQSIKSQEQEQHVTPKAEDETSADYFAHSNTATTPASNNDSPIDAKVMYDYEPSEDGELPVHENDLVRIISPDDGSGWIKVRDSSNREGHIPAAYVQMKSGKTASLTNLAEQAQTPSPSQSPAPEKLRALYDYNAVREDEISFQAGEVVQLTQTSQHLDDWVQVQKGSQVGIVPSNYFEPA